METKRTDDGAIQIYYKGVCIAEVQAYENEPGIDIVKVWSADMGEDAGKMHLFSLKEYLCEKCHERTIARNGYCSSCHREVFKV